jgi:hypothetical protein
LIVVFVVISIGSCTRLVAASRIDLDRDWMFRTDPDSIGQRSDWQSHPPTDTLSINLPHTWNLGRQDGYLGKAWYCKTFAMPLQSPDLHVKLHCQNDVIARTSGLVLRRGSVSCGVLRSSLAVSVSFMQTCVNIESFAALGSGLCQHCSYLRSHSRQPLMRPIEIPENRAG